MSVVYLCVCQCMCVCVERETERERGVRRGDWINVLCATLLWSKILISPPPFSQGRVWAQLHFLSFFISQHQVFDLSYLLLPKKQKVALLLPLPVHRLLLVPMFPAAHSPLADGGSVLLQPHSRLLPPVERTKPVWVRVRVINLGSNKLKTGY